MSFSIPLWFFASLFVCILLCLIPFCAIFLLFVIIVPLLLLFSLISRRPSPFSFPLLELLLTVLSFSSFYLVLPYSLLSPIFPKSFFSHCISLFLSLSSLPDSFDHWFSTSISLTLGEKVLSSLSLWLPIFSILISSFILVSYANFYNKSPAHNQIASWP